MRAWIQDLLAGAAIIGAVLAVLAVALRVAGIAGSQTVGAWATLVCSASSLTASALRRRSGMSRFAVGQRRRHGTVTLRRVLNLVVAVLLAVIGVVVIVGVTLEAVMTRAADPAVDVLGFIVAVLAVGTGSAMLRRSP